MVESISTLGLQLISASNLSGGQSALSTLSQQLTTGKYSTNMADYTSSNAQKLLNLTSKINTQEGFLTIINTLTPRLEAYDAALTGIEDTVSDAYSTLLSNSTYNEGTNEAVASSIQGYLDDIVYYLNQQSGDRYIFSGSRYDTAPVISSNDIIALGTPSTTTVVTDPALPDYDTQAALGTSDAAWMEESATIDTTKTLTYGVTSTEEGFQQVILGLQWAYAATQDPTNYETYMQNALDLLSEGLPSIRSVHTAMTNAYDALDKTASMIETKVSSLETQIDNIEAVDVNEVSIKIEVLKAQLEAAYAVTAQIINLSLLDYL